jgi:hypothetical protein
MINRLRDDDEEATVYIDENEDIYLNGSNQEHGSSHEMNLVHSSSPIQL